MTELDIQKKATIQELLSLTDCVYLHVNAAAENVVVPIEVRKGASFTLQISYSFNGVMSFEDQAMVAELRFGNGYVTCEVPYPAIWAATTPSFHLEMWPESSPGEPWPDLLKAHVAEDARKAGKKVPKLKSKNTKTAVSQIKPKALAAVKEPEPEEKVASRSEIKDKVSESELPPEGKKVITRGHLRLVK